MKVGDGKIIILVEIIGCKTNILIGETMFSQLNSLSMVRGGRKIFYVG